MPKKNYKLEDYRRVGQELFDRMHLPTFPIAAKFLQSTEDIPEGVGIRRPELEGNKMSICQCLSKARRLGEAWALTAVDNFCTPMTVGMGWVKGITEEEIVESQIKQKWHRDPDAERKVFEATESYRSGDSFGGLARQAEQMLMLQNMGNIGIMTAPLLDTPFIPDTVIIYGSPVHIGYLIAALSYERKKKYEINTAFVGFGECTKGTIMPHMTQKPHIMLPGNGDRSYGGIQDYELGIGMPAKHAVYALENLFKAGKVQGMGLPLRQEFPNVDERITPGYIYMREVIDRKLAEQKQLKLQQEATN